jgi:hypothetical protein
VTVFAGRGVEFADDWFCEAVWPGDFADGGFDFTDLISGSGARARGGRITFVSSGSTVDRLQSCVLGDVGYIANSLPCLLTAMQASVDPSYPRYYEDAMSVIQGLDRYKRTLRTDKGNIELTYFDNLVWDGSQLSTERKPVLPRDFSTFAHYERFLHETMAAVVANMSATARARPLQAIGTLSSGYDSTATSVLAVRAGCREVITFSHARGGDEDSGHVAARHLGLATIPIDRHAWRSVEFAEVPFLASYSSAEDVNFAAAAPYLADRVLFTGYHGDKLWDKKTKNLSDQIVRGDPSGLALTEFRLATGFIHCPVPFWGVRQIRDIHAISNAACMAPWDVGGNYSRPICRRLAEEAGIPRHAFGKAKRAITVNPYAGGDFRPLKGQFLTPASLTDYLGWLRSQARAWLRSGRLPPIPSAGLNYAVNRAHMAGVDLHNRVAGAPGLWRLLGGRSYQPRYLHRYLFPWAVGRAMQPYTGHLASADTRPFRARTSAA